MYLKEFLLDVQLLGCGFAWLDTGIMASLLDVANFVEMIQSRHGITISAPEEIAFINGFIDKEQLMESAKAYGKSPYGEHLKAVAEGRVRYWNAVRLEYDEVKSIKSLRNHFISISELAVIFNQPFIKPAIDYQKHSGLSYHAYGLIRSGW